MTERRKYWKWQTEGEEKPDKWRNEGRGQNRGNKVMDKIERTEMKWKLKGQPGKQYTETDHEMEHNCPNDNCPDDKCLHDNCPG